MADTIQFGRQLAVFTDALYRKDEKLAAAMMIDVIAEPYRKSLLPRFDESRVFANNTARWPLVFQALDQQYLQYVII